MKAPFLHTREDIIHSEGEYLPHWEQEGVWYFVTFRLADSLPEGKLKEWSVERENWAARHGHNPSPAQLQAYQWLYHTRVAEWLDAGHGSMLLGEDCVREVVVEALTYFEGERYFLDEWVVASTHVHVLVQPRKGVRLSRVIHTWKSVTAKRILALPEGRRLGGTATVWQGDYWDRIVRNRAHLECIRSYIRRHAAYRVPDGPP